MEKAIEQLLPGLLKSFPILSGVGLLLWFITKLIINYLEKRDNKREKYFIDEMDKREKYFISEIEKRDKFYATEMAKKDSDHKAAELYYQGLVREKDEAMQVLNDKLVAVTNKFIEVTNNTMNSLEKNSVIIANLKEVIAAMKLVRP